MSFPTRQNADQRYNGRHPIHAQFRLEREIGKGLTFTKRAPKKESVGVL